MLLPGQKPSSLHSLLKFVFVTSQLRHSLVVNPFLRKILDPPLVIIFQDEAQFKQRKNTVRQVVKQELR